MRPIATTAMTIRTNDEITLTSHPTAYKMSGSLLVNPEITP